MTGISGSLKYGIKKLLLVLGYDKYVIRKARGFLVLCYHSIPNSGQWLYDVPSKEFEEHLLYLKKRFRIVNAKDLMTPASSSKKNNVPLAITFDDGYEDNYINAVPVLRKHKIPATFFISSGNIDARINRIIEPSENVVKRMMSWSQVAEISEDPLFDVGSHGHNHLNMTKLTPDEMAGEVFESIRQFQSHTRNKPKLFAYPGGFHNQETKSQLEKVGFAYGFTSSQRVNPYQVDQLEIGRIAITLSHRKVASLAYAIANVIRNYPE